MKNKYLISVIVIVVLIAGFAAWRFYSAQRDTISSVHFKIQPLSPGFSNDY